MNDQQNTIELQKVIIAKMQDLLSDFEKTLGSDTPQKTLKKHIAVKDKKGAMGAIQLLIEEGFLDTPKDITAILNKLKEIGHYHQRASVEMNLFNLNKRRELNRFKGQKTKKWEYVIRK